MDEILVIVIPGVLVACFLIGIIVVSISQKYAKDPWSEAVRIPDNSLTVGSLFTGGLGGLIGTNIVYFLIIFFSLGICTPWAVCYKQQWITKNTVINGYKLGFDGKGSQLFGKYILWFLLTIITFGISGLLLNYQMKKWVTKHTYIQGYIPAASTPTPLPTSPQPLLE